MRDKRELHRATRSAGSFLRHAVSIQRSPSRKVPLQPLFCDSSHLQTRRICDVDVAWERGTALAVPVLCSSPISFELEVDKEILTGEHDEVVLMCRIRNTLKDEKMVNSSMTSAEILKATAAVRTCVDYDYWSWDGRHLGKWHERAKEIKPDVEIGAAARGN